MKTKKLPYSNMTKNKNVLLPILINIRYKHSMNKFEEVYGENIPYSQIEQESYIELKEMVMAKIKRKIKFRKRGREGMILSLKAEMYQAEYEKFILLNNNNDFNFIYEFFIEKVEIIENEEIKNNE